MLAVAGGPFFGRERELEAIDARFRAGRRLVTLVGLPGAGKTRLAAEYLRRLGDDGAAEEVVKADLVDALRDVDGLRSLYDALGLRWAPGRAEPTVGPQAIASVVASLEGRRVCLWLDHCEKVSVAFVQAVSDVLRAAPGLRIVATSWRPLALEQEAVIQVGPLGAGAARALFLERARAQGMELELDDEVSRLVDELDRIPLSLELAAGRARLLTPKELRARISDRLELLQTRERDRPRRHRSLEAALDDLWDSLGEDERELLSAMAVARGSTSVTALVTHLVSEAASPRAFDLLERLASRGLARIEASSTGARCHISDVLRVHVAHRVDLAPFRRRHAAHHAALAESLVQGAAWTGEAEARERFDQEVPNFLATAECWTEAPTDALRAVLAIQEVDHLRGILGLQRHHFDRALAIATAAGEDRLIARCLLARAKWRKRAGEAEGAYADAEAALERLGPEVSDELGIEARALRAFYTMWTGKPPHETSEALIDAAAESGSVFALAECKRIAAAYCQMRGALAQSVVLTEAASELYASLGYAPLERRARVNLGHILCEAREFERARTVLEAVMREAAEAEDEEIELAAATYLALTRLDEGDQVGAQELLDQATERLLRRGSLALAVTALQAMGNVAAERVGGPGSGVQMAEARRHFHRSISMASEGGFEYGAVCGRNYLGQHELITGNLSSARRHLEAAAVFALKQGSQRMLAEAGGWLRVALAETGESSTAHLEALLPHERAAGIDGSQQAWVADLSQVLESPEPATHPALPSLRKLASTPLEGSFDDRLARRLVGAVLRRKGLLGPTNVLGPRLVVAQDGRWARVDESAPVRLERSPVLRRLLLALVERHRQTPSDPLSSRDLVEAGWPGERILDTAASNRVYDSIRRLRKMGLDSVLQSSRDGYAFDPRCRVAYVPSDMPPPEASRAAELH